MILGCLFISVGFNIYFIFDPKVVSEPIQEEKNKNKQMVCHKYFDLEDGQSLYNQIINISETGKVIDTQLIIVSTYYNNEAYNKVKNIRSEFSVITTDDSKREITRTLEKTKVLDDNDNEIDTWYVSYVSNFENSGYECEMSE